MLWRFASPPMATLRLIEERSVALLCNNRMKLQNIHLYSYELQKNRPRKPAHTTNFTKTMEKQRRGQLELKLNMVEGELRVFNYKFTDIILTTRLL